MKHYTTLHYTVNFFMKLFFMYDTVFHVMCTSFTPIFLYFTDLSAINGIVTDHEFLIRNEPVIE